MPHIFATADQRAIMFDLFEQHEPEIMMRKNGLAARLHIQLQEMNVPMKLSTVSAYMRYYASTRREYEDCPVLQRQLFIAHAHS
jgi:hypothetical protein